MISKPIQRNLMLGDLKKCGLGIDVAAGAPAGRSSKSARRPTRGSAATRPSRRFKCVDTLVLSMRLIALLAAAVMSASGCSVAGDGKAFSLEDAGVEIAAATQRSSDCGDINPVLTAEQASNALQELFDLSDGLLTLEAFTAEQVVIFNERADTLCGTTSDDNGNQNENDNANSNDNSNGNQNDNDNG